MEAHLEHQKKMMAEVGSGTGKSPRETALENALKKLSAACRKCSKQTEDRFKIDHDTIAHFRNEITTLSASGGGSPNPELMAQVD